MADTHAKHHDYHLVNPSVWPAVGATFAFVMAVGLVIWMRSMGDGAGLFGLRGPTVFLVGAAGVTLTMFMWWRDVIKEAHGGDHTPVVQLHLRYGMIMFIASEVMFFVAWFWAYFDASLFPAAVHPLEITLPDGTVEPTKELVGMVERNALTGGHWPPEGQPQFHRHVRSVGAAAGQHADPAHLGHDRHLGAPCAAGKQPQGIDLGPRAHRCPRNPVHGVPSL